jgi:uncharacterized membrane protein YhaH (DUF805 family)
MLLNELLFSFQGRINRPDFWMAFLATCVGALATAGLVIGIYYILIWTRGLQAVPGFGASWILAGLLVFGPLTVITLALGAKRLHDRGKSGWWLFLYWIVGGILVGLGYWYLFDTIGYVMLGIGAFLVLIGFVDIGLGQGTVGPNYYGPDPSHVG